MKRQFMLSAATDGVVSFGEEADSLIIKTQVGCDIVGTIGDGGAEVIAFDVFRWVDHPTESAHERSDPLSLVAFQDPDSHLLRWGFRHPNGVVDGVELRVGDEVRLRLRFGRHGGPPRKLLAVVMVDVEFDETQIPRRPN